jgi:dTMP kinase
MSEGRRGTLVALEGIDGAGKSSLARALATTLRHAGFSVRERREPTDPRIGRIAQEAAAKDAWTGAVYFTVDRHLARRSLERDLASCDVVLTDRSYYSTLAYQGSVLRPGERRRLERLQRAATVPPDRVLLLDLPVALALPRVVRRTRGEAKGRGPLERTRTLRRVSAEYRRLARRHRFVVLDARLGRAELVRLAFAALGLPARSPRAKRRGGNRYPPRPNG